jgi:hypothetical protein
MNLIETNKALLSFYASNPKVVLAVPVWSSPKAHEYDTSISFLYLRTNDSDYIINFNHIDAQRCNLIKFDRLISPNTLVFGNRYLDTKGLDYEWVYFEEYGKPFILNEFAEEVYRGYRSDFKYLNDCIPLMRWYEVLKRIPLVSDIKEWHRVYSDSIRTLGRLEGAGVKVDEENFIDRFHFNNEYLPKGFAYTKYNPYTVTGRPSNRHLGVNWAAMNKSDGSRANIVSRFKGGTLLQFDYESYHIRIIGKMVGYRFAEGETAHEHLAKYYGVSTEESKALSFKYLYGGLDEFAKGIPFFQKVDEYIQSVYQKFVISGRLTTPLYKREIPFQRIEGATEQKVFNYLLQALETEINYKKIEEVLKCLDGRRSKMILYTYDAFLIDVHPTEKEWVLKDLKFILERGGFPVRAYEGSNYDNLELIP